MTTQPKIISYREAQTRCKAYKMKGYKTPKLTSKKTVLIAWLLATPTAPVSSLSKQPQVLIGAGNYSYVYKQETRAGTSVAVKSFKDRQYRIFYFLREYTLLKCLDHPCVLTLQPESGVVLKPLSIILPLYKSTLKSVNVSECSRKELTQITADILSGIGYMHSLGMIHNDIKPQNILLTENKRAAISDFGGTSLYSYGLTRAFGLTLQYTAPEYLLSESVSVSTKTDIWSLGWLFVNWLCPQTLNSSDSREREERIRTAFRNYILVVGFSEGSLNANHVSEFPGMMNLLSLANINSNVAKKRQKLLRAFSKANLDNIGKVAVKMLVWDPKDRIPCADAIAMLQVSTPDLIVTANPQSKRPRVSCPSITEEIESLQGSDFPNSTKNVVLIAYNYYSCCKDRFEGVEKACLFRNCLALANTIHPSPKSHLDDSVFDGELTSIVRIIEVIANKRNSVVLEAAQI